MMPPTGDEVKPETKPADDFTDTQIAAGDCKDLKELEEHWNKYPEHQKNNIFAQIIKARKVAIVTAKK